MTAKYSTYYNYHAYEYPTLEEDYDQEETNSSLRETPQSQSRDTEYYGSKWSQVLLSRLPSMGCLAQQGRSSSSL